MDYLQIIHMKTHCHDFTASNLFSMISTLVMYLVLKPSS